MARLTWFTQPPTNNRDLRFASFYMYDTVSLDFVRIRLELNRAAINGDNGDTFIVCRHNRIVEILQNNNWNQVTDQNIPTPNIAIRDYNQNAGVNTAHNGYNITANPYLPNGITAMDLHILASMYIGNNINYSLGPNNATEPQLVNAIRQELNGQV